jgi:hypothetical protein
MEHEEELLRDELSGCYIVVATEESIIGGNIDSFVALSRENTSVKEVELYPFDSDAGNYEFWDKVGQLVGNLMELQMITIHFLPIDYFESDDDGDEPPSPDWEALTRILRYLRHKVKFCSSPQENGDEVEEIQGLAGAIHGHPMISAFCLLVKFKFANLGPLCSTLVTLPSLECVTLGLQEPETEEQLVLINPESFTSLLRAPALRFVTFCDFCFTNALCHATANALEEGSSVTDITFDSDCSFPDGGTAIIANALKRNVSVTDVEFLGDDFDEPFFNTLAAVLLYNSTLQNLAVQAASHARGRWISAILLSALGMNATLKSLSVSIDDTFGDKLCAAISSGLAKNSTLEELSLYDMIPSDDDGAVFARNALSFLRTNSTLKSLTVSFLQARKESYVSAFLLEAVKVLENTFLESFTISSYGRGRGIEVEDFLALISALQLNTTLKTLDLQYYWFENISFTVDELNRLVSMLRKNYGLEHILPNVPCAEDGTVKAILRLNKAGRRYVIQDGSSIPKGVDVLSAVSDEIDCVFLHLLENPGLCERRATRTATGRRRPDANLDKSSSTGKRERAQSQSGKEPCRRL